MILVTFFGIDGWNRPVFQGTDGYFYGSVNKLFEFSDGVEEVMAEITPQDICYFGTKFGCEPDGTPAEVRFA